MNKAVFEHTETFDYEDAPEVLEEANKILRSVTDENPEWRKYPSNLTIVRIGERHHLTMRIEDPNGAVPWTALAWFAILVVIAMALLWPNL